jgi:hypothetical protein
MACCFALALLWRLFVCLFVSCEKENKLFVLLVSHRPHFLRMCQSIVRQNVRKTNTHHTVLQYYSTCSTASSSAQLSFESGFFSRRVNKSVSVSIVRVKNN